MLLCHLYHYWHKYTHHTTAITQYSIHSMHRTTIIASKDDFKWVYLPIEQNYIGVYSGTCRNGASGNGGDFTSQKLW